jgi:hypothetical protein
VFAVVEIEEPRTAGGMDRHTHRQVISVSSATTDATGVHVCPAPLASLLLADRSIAAQFSREGKMAVAQADAHLVLSSAQYRGHSVEMRIWLQPHQ